jgi:hypothetical protein
MKTLMRLASVSLLALSVAAVGCGGSTADTSPQTAQSAATLAPVGAQTHGPVRLVGEALGDVPLRPDQRTELEKLASDAEARHQATLSARKDIVDAVAAQVEAGKIDRAALQPKIDAAADAWAKVQGDDRAASSACTRSSTPASAPNSWTRSRHGLRPSTASTAITAAPR